MQGESVELRQALIALGALLPAAAFAQVERFAVVVGNDVGQPPDVAHLPGADKAKIWEPAPQTIYNWGGH